MVRESSLGNGAGVHSGMCTGLAEGLIIRWLRDLAGVEICWSRAILNNRNKYVTLLQKCMYHSKKIVACE